MTYWCFVSAFGAYISAQSAYLEGFVAHQQRVDGIVAETRVTLAARGSQLP